MVNCLWNIVASISSSPTHVCEYLLFYLFLPLDIITHSFTNQFDRCSPQYHSSVPGMWSPRGILLSVFPIYWHYSSLEGGSPLRILTQMHLGCGLVSQTKKTALETTVKVQGICLANGVLTKVSSLTFWPDNVLLFWQIFDEFRRFIFVVYILSKILVCLKWNL